MCGIAGFFSTDPRPRTVGARMLHELRRRGPDARHQVTWDAAFHRDATGPVSNALLHARLSIIDPRPEADQPMSNASGDVWICYNGEVYDWAAHADELRSKGAVFRTRSDTEFILHAYEAWGDDCLSRLRGMFAFAILDLRRRRVLLARDRLGLKPLIYTLRDGQFAFGSTVRSVLPFLARDRRGFSADAIDAYLAHRYVPAPLTIIDGVNRLENAHCLVFDLDTRRLEKRRYWTPQPRNADWLETLDAAVAMRTVADRPVGVFLSSGIDSSVIAARLARLGKRDLHTFTAAFPGSSMDESPLAAEIAQHLGLVNHPVIVPDTVAEDFSRIVADLDEPFADPSSVPSWYLARATTQHVKVVLGGDGGDEVLAGYKRIAKHLRTAWRRGLRIPGLKPAITESSKGWRKWTTELGMDWREAYSLRFSGFTPGQRRFLQPRRHDLPPTHWRLPAGADGSAIAALLAVDWDNYLPEYVLRKADLCTMAHGLELRAPLLDHPFFETLLGLPEEQRFTQPAKVLLEPACTELQDLDLFRRKKKGFNPPLTGWLRQDLVARFDGLGERLSEMTGEQLSMAGVNRIAASYLAGEEALAEQVLQLMILDESLAQIAVLGETANA
jgi:asparagine synthase (glutamine-hydrolysing)